MRGLPIGVWLDSVRKAPWYFRALLRVSLVSLFALGPAATLCSWLTVGFVTEAWPWFLWLDSYLHLADTVMTLGRPVVYFVLLVIVWWLAGKLVNPKPEERQGWSRVLHLVPHLGSLAVVSLCVALLLPLLLVGSVRVVRTWPPRTNHLLIENCGHCHSPYRPQHYIKSADSWTRTVRRMIDRNGAPVSEEDAAKIIAWLQDYRGFSDSWMFRAKCIRCHGKSHLEATPRTAEEWRYTVDRLAWLSPFAYRVDQREQIKRHLAENLSVSPPPEGSPERVALDRRLELQKACNGCHSISLILEEGAMDDPRAMVERMSKKNPEFVPPDRVDDYAQWLKELPTDPDAFWALFPHDILMDLE